jgi:hypothetical protein
MPSEKEGVIGGEPGPLGSACPDGDPACVSVQVLFDGDGTEILHDFVLPGLMFRGEPIAWGGLAM